ncbi:MAG: DegV family protein [Clostridia bacterium]|nr:DegV family protein [Clostridia bacterium]
MNDYVIYTDSGCDLSPDTLRSWGVPYQCLTFKFDGSERVYSNTDMDEPTFYAKMRAGGVAKTSAVNSETFFEAFKELLDAGKDILYIGFSSGLSNTYNAARIAAEELRESYPSQKVMTVDSLSGSAGQGLLVYLALEQKKQGATIEEAAAFAEKLSTRICHWITVEDLVYLKRGGRISPTVAFVGNALGLKPMIRITDEGKLHSHSKARGRKKAIEALVERYSEYAEDAANGTVFISHADCEQDAREVGEKLKARFGVEVRLLTQIGPVIGSHAGPGTIALCFVGTHR